MSGLMSVTGFPEAGYTRVGVAMGDSVASMFATYGILAALFNRERSGEGQYLETSLLGGLIALLGYQAGKYFSTGQTPMQMGNDHGVVGPYGTYKTRNSKINITAGTHQMWVKLCQVLNMNECISDERFKTNDSRVENRAALRVIIENRLSYKDSEEWIQILNKEGIPCGPIYTIDEVFKDKQVIHQEMLLEAIHKSIGPIKMIGFPVKMEKSPCRINFAPPVLGEHTDEILKELGYSREEITELRKNNVV
jgi:crotonobetainyl-CoA:carnitine CoA-transferase CaiB-like acyl-CoA transferase